MIESSLAQASGRLPRPRDPARAERVIGELKERGFELPANSQTLLAAAFGNSPYLARLALREAEFLREILRQPPKALLAELIAVLDAVPQAATSAEAMSLLRRTKQQTALAIAFADISNAWSVAEIHG